MNGEKFKVVVKGPAQDQDSEEVRKKVAAIYQNDLKKADIFFQGKPVTIGQGVEKEKALKLKKVFEGVGMIVSVSPVGSIIPTAPPAPATPRQPPATPVETMTCPGCGHEQPKSPACVKCGIVLEKFKKKQESPALTKDPDQPAPASSAPPRPGQPPEPPGPEKVAPGPGMAGVRLMYEEEDKEPIVFLNELPKAFAYPFVGKGPYVVLAGLVFFLLIIYIPFIGFILWLIGMGYYCAYMMKIVNSTADGETEPPPWPGFSDFTSDVVAPLLKVAWVSIACFLPAVVYLLLSGLAGLTNPIFYLLLFGGAIYYPMALLAVAMSGNFLALNPLVVIPAIVKVPLDYLICLAAFLIVIIFNGVAKNALNLPIPLVGPAIQTFLTIYFMMIEMRILGLLYRANQDELGWYT